MSSQAHHASSSHSSGSSNVIGVHFRVGRKIGEGSFGVIFEGESALSLAASFVSRVRD